MLILGRRVGEAVVLGGGIEVQVVEVSGSRVKLGITAPRAVEILRKEVKLAREENRAAAQGLGPDAVGQLLGRLRQ